MAKFTFKNISDAAAIAEDKVFVVSPTLVYNKTFSVDAAKEDLAIKAGDVRLPIYEHGVHQFVTIRQGETFTVEPTDAPEVAFYTNLVNCLNADGLKTIIEATIVNGANPSL